MTNPTLRGLLARRLAEVHGAADTTSEPLYEDDADAALRVIAERMDAIAIVEPATTWEAAYKQLRREVGGAV